MKYSRFLTRVSQNRQPSLIREMSKSKDPGKWFLNLCKDILSKWHSTNWTYPEQLTQKPTCLYTCQSWLEVTVCCGDCRCQVVLAHCYLGIIKHHMLQSNFFINLCCYLDLLCITQTALLKVFSFCFSTKNLLVTCGRKQLKVYIGESNVRHWPFGFCYGCIH